jgi:hypothetical protein
MYEPCIGYNKLTRTRKDSIRMRKNFGPFVFFLAVTIILVSYFTYFGKGLLNEQDTIPTVAKPQSQTDESESDLKFDLEEKLVEKKTAGGYIIETYREYEIYKDDKGNIIKSIPTSNYNYLRYKTKQ